MTILRALLGKYATVLVAIAFLAVLAFAGVQTLRLAETRVDYAHLQAEIAKERQGAAEAWGRSQERARKTEQTLAEQAAAERKSAHEKQRALAARVDSLRRQLRDRPERPAVPAAGAVAPAASPGSCGTGAGLYRPDAEVALWFAARAAEHAAERDTCRAQYDAAREALKRGQSK